MTISPSDDARLVATKRRSIRVPVPFQNAGARRTAEPTMHSKDI
jgi:hypothetical protein